MPSSTALYSKEEVKAKFVTKTLKCLEGEPTYETITKLKQEIFAKTAAVPTKLGGGQHEQVGLVAPATVYSTLFSTKSITPKEPKQPTFAATTTDATKVRKLEEFKEAQRIYDSHHTVDRVLKQQIKAAVDKKYLEELSEPLVGYMNISAMDMINHLVD
eukprot:1955126-Ditylum_brightwellii.AAC.1